MQRYWPTQCHFAEAVLNFNSWRIAVLRQTDAKSPDGIILQLDSGHFGNATSARRRFRQHIATETVICDHRGCV